MSVSNRIIRCPEIEIGRENLREPLPVYYGVVSNPGNKDERHASFYANEEQNQFLNDETVNENIIIVGCDGCIPPFCDGFV